MKHIVATLCGIGSGFLIYMLVCLAFLLPKAQPNLLHVTVFFFGGWIATHALLVRNAKSALKVLSRGCLVGAMEWLLIPAASVIMASKIPLGGTSAAHSASAKTDAAIANGIVGLLTGSVSIFMIAVCLLGFFISSLLSREMKPETSSDFRECPYCAEIISPKAKKCKHCGSEVQPLIEAA